MRTTFEAIRRQCPCRLAIVIGLIAGAGIVQRSTAADSDLPAEVKKQVRLLTDRDLATRDKAEAKLMELGPAVLELLPAISGPTQAELKHRLTRIRQSLEKAEAEAAAAARTITLKGELPLAEVLAEFEKQTGNRVVDIREEFGQEAGEIKVDVSIDKEEFWPALDKVLDRAKLQAYPYQTDDEHPGRGLIGLIAQQDGAAPREGRVGYHGPFRIEALRVEATRGLRNPEQQSLTVYFEIAWEPRLSPIAITLPLDTVKAIDADGKVQLVGGGEGVHELPVNPGASAVEGEIRLQLPPRDLKVIDKLTGKLHVLVPGSTVEFRFENMEGANKAEQQQGGATVTLDTVRQNNELWQVHMRAKYEKASNALESHRDWFYRNEAYVLDADGNQIEYAGFEKTRETEDEFGMAYLYELPKGPKGLTFVYKTPVVMLNLPVEFELKNIPLP